MSNVSQTAEALRRLLLSYERLDVAWRRHFGLSANEKLVVLFLMEGSTSTPTELATSIGMTTAGITSLLDRLEAHDFLRRERHATDGRRVLVTPTKKGVLALMMFERTTQRLAERAISRGESFAAELNDFLADGERVFLDATFDDDMNIGLIE
ncbi:MAG: MarR family transcriptional regulator [Thermoleophilia bacterium]|nr:MarR family transcriptional regulator [Thermoleophilia bacterium]